MSGHRPFGDLTKRLPAARKARIDDKAAALHTALTLHELRKTRAVSQAQLARKLAVGQPAVAKIERRSDMYVSNLRRYVEALGGTLEISARFPDGAVTITQEATMATNPPKGDHHRIGEVRDRSQTFNPKTEQWVKRDADSGRFLDVKQDGAKFKGVRREHPKGR
jgi:transcriptional regulator with XRE-family HTH domain